MASLRDRPLALLHIDSAYTLEGARARSMMHFLFGRAASGLFPRVWSVHPLADIAESDFNGIRVTHLGKGHGLIEGQASLCGLPRWLAPIDFRASQFALYRALVSLVRSMTSRQLRRSIPHGCSGEANKSVLRRR